MNPWYYEREGYEKERVVEDGNRFLTANGYMGIRGTVEEAEKDSFPAVNLAGIYDQYENLWREPVNAPNGLFCSLSFRGEPMALGKREPVTHRIGVDYRRGIFYRETDFGPVAVETRRISSMANAHLSAMQVKYRFRESGEAVIRCGIDGAVWDINGPHLFGAKAWRNTQGILSWSGYTGEKHIWIAANQSVRYDFAAEEADEVGEGSIFRNITFHANAGQEYVLEVFAAVRTDADHDIATDIEECYIPEDAANTDAILTAERGFDKALAAHCSVWEGIWKNSGITLTGNEEAARGLIASQYHLNNIAPRHSPVMSIPARGLSGQTYKGAVFWDTEVFLFPMFVYTQPQIARSFLRYRIDTLKGARKKAKEYGYRGAFYAWESQEGGEEGCTNFNVVDVFTHRPVRTYFRDKQIHISGDVAYAMRQYYEITGDRGLLENGGAEVLLECARFYLSRASAHLDSAAVDFSDVIGPDEYHERVTNNAFTNTMVRYTMESALKLEEIFADKPEYLENLLGTLNYREDWELLKRVLPRIRETNVRDGIIEQFDGYFGLEDCSLSEVRSRLCNPREYWGGDHGVAGTTQIIKQADVIAMMAMLPDRYSEETVARNWNYYEPRTEHGSSLSACMYALTACRIGQPDRAWELFMKSAVIDVTGVSKQWAGEIYIGGTHPASNGGAWMIAVQGFAGMRLEKGELIFEPQLPKEIDTLQFPIVFRGEHFRVTVTREGVTKEPM